MNIVVGNVTWADGIKKCKSYNKDVEMKMAAVTDFEGYWQDELKEGDYWTRTKAWGSTNTKKMAIK